MRALRITMALRITNVYEFTNPGEAPIRIDS